MRFFGGVVVVLLGFVLIAGCMSSVGPDTKPTTAPAVKTGAPPTTVLTAATTVTPTPTQPPTNRYNAGDIVRNPASTSNTAWAIIEYNHATDMYGRAMVYLDSEGKWRLKDTTSDNAGRMAFEKIYTEKIPGAMVYSPKTPEPTQTEVTPTESPVTITTTYVQSDRVVIISIEPAFAFRRQPNEVIVTGIGFTKYSDVVLKSVGDKPDVPAKVVLYDNENRLRVIFDAPLTALGTYDFVVSNLDGTIGVKEGGFRIS